VHTCIICSKSFRYFRHFFLHLHFSFIIYQSDLCIMALCTVCLYMYMCMCVPLMFFCHLYSMYCSTMICRQCCEKTFRLCNSARYITDGTWYIQLRAVYPQCYIYTSLTVMQNRLASVNGGFSRVHCKVFVLCCY